MYEYSVITEHHENVQILLPCLKTIPDAFPLKVSKGTKIAGITGGATTVAGGVAAAAGVILSPLTLGASLALTAVGVGVAAAGGITGASAAIANKVTERETNSTDSLWLCLWLVFGRWQKVCRCFQMYGCILLFLMHYFVVLNLTFVFYCTNGCPGTRSK